jgi:hypothetical protein
MDLNKTIPCLTPISKEKIDLLKTHVKSVTITPEMTKIVNKMGKAFAQPIDFKPAKNQVSQSEIKSEFIKWNKSLNSTEKTIFETEMDKMNKSLGLDLKIGKAIIHVKILYQDSDQHIISAIMHAINTFLYFIDEKNSNGLNIIVCLNDLPRILGCTSSTTYDSQVKCLQKHSMGMNVSGSTIRAQNIIHLTRQEEIIKLLFHELIHYVGLENELLDITFPSKWATTDKTLTAYEAYTEFISVVLNSAYLAWHLKGLIKVDPMESFQAIISYEVFYSVYLCKKILEFYGYDQTTFMDFFNNEGKKHKQPILLWEYIFLRANLMLEMTKVLHIVEPDTLYLTPDTVGSVVAIMQSDLDLTNYLKEIFKIKFIPNNSVSYLAVDVDWKQF